MRVYVFQSYTCGVCEEHLKPLIPELLAELPPRGVPVDVVETAGLPIYPNPPLDPRRKLLKELNYRGICGTPTIVIVDDQGEARVIFGTRSREDLRYQILSQVFLAMISPAVDHHERRFSLWVRAYQSAVESGNPWYVLDIARTIYLSHKGMRSWGAGRIRGIA